jgi:hypothetical protein
MDLKSYDLRDPDRLIEQIAARHRLEEGTALLAVVADPSTTQNLTHVEPLPVDARIAHYEDVRKLLRETMQRMPLPGFAGPDTRHLVVTVLVRPGLTVMGRHESQWLLGWRYSNHLKGAFDGELFLVTEHGWLHFQTDWGDHEPRMQPRRALSGADQARWRARSVGSPRPPAPPACR